MLTDDPAPRLPTTTKERRMVAWIGGILGALMVAEVLRGFSPLKLSIFFVLLFWVPLLVLHELGHALAARSVGWRVSEIVIGFGRELTRFRLGHTRVRVRAAPLEGYVVPSPSDVRGSRWKSAWVYAAGPGIELLFVLVCWIALGDDLLRASENLGVLAVQSACVAALLGAGFNLLPYIAGAQMSDGLGILASLSASDESFRAQLAAPFASEARRALYAEQVERAERWVQYGLEKYPGDWQLQALAAVCLAARGDEQAAIRDLEALGHPDDKPPGVRVELLLDAAWVVLLSRDRKLLGDAQQACERARHLAPEHIRVNLLLGRILLERQRNEEAYRFLMDAYKLCKDADEEAQLVAYLAIVCRRLNRADYAQRFAREMRRMPPGPALQSQVLEELEPAQP